MKIKDFLKAAGKRLLREVPGVDVVLDVVEAATGGRPDKDHTTAEQLAESISTLPPEAQAKILDIEIKALEQTGETHRAMLEAEANSRHTTRPKIAMGAFRVVAFVTILIASIWAVAVLQGNAKLVTAVTDGWPFVAALLLPFVGWLNSYFGILRTEHQNRLDSAGSNTKRSGLGGLIEAARAKF